MNRLAPGFTVVRATILVAVLAVLSVFAVRAQNAAVPADPAALEKALANDPENPERYVALGEALLAANQGERAGKVYRRLIDLRPNDCRGHEGLARSFLAQNLADHAMRVAEDARKICPNDPKVQMVLTRAYVGADEDVLAIESAQRAIELDPNHLPVYEILGETLYGRGMYAEAAAVYEAVLVRPGLQEESSVVKTANARLARLYLWGGAVDRAAPYVERAIASGPLDAATLGAMADDLAKDSACRADLRLMIADACAKAGDPDRARPAYERVSGCGTGDEKDRARIGLEALAASGASKSR